MESRHSAHNLAQSLNSEILLNSIDFIVKKIFQNQIMNSRATGSKQDKKPEVAVGLEALFYLLKVPDWQPQDMHEYFGITLTQTPF